MPTITKEDFASDDPLLVAFVESIMLEEDRRFLATLPANLRELQRKERIKRNRRKNQKRARAGRR